MTTTLADIHPDIIQAHILPRLDGPSLSTAATSSPYLKTFCSDHTLWSQISRSTWPSISHPRVHDVISTFPSGHRSFFTDSFPALTTDSNHRTKTTSAHATKSECPSCHLDCSSCGSELISAVDIRYLNDVVYSTVNFTDTRSDLLSSPFRIKLIDDQTRTRPGSDPNSNRTQPEFDTNLIRNPHRSGLDPTRIRPESEVDGVSRSIDLTVDEIVGADKATLSHLKDSLTLSWILIDPVRRRAGNLSSVKPVSVKADWVTNETHVRYVTVLPGCDPNEMVQCRIDVVLGVGERGVGLKVKEVELKLQDLDSCCLNGMEFLVITQGAIMEKNNVRRKVADDEEMRMRYKGFKEMKNGKKEWVKRKQRKREVVVNFGFVAVLMSILIFLYFFILL